MFIPIPILTALVLLVIGRFLVGKEFRASWKHLFLWLLFGILSAVPIVLIQTPFDRLVESSFKPDTIPYGFVTGFFCASLIEECIKFVILLLCLRKRPAYRCTYDAVLAAAAIAGGYGIAEGVFIPSWLSFIAPVAHICFTVFMGFFFGKASQAQLAGNTSRKTTFLILSVLVPFLLHGFYDFIRMSGDFPGSTAILLLYNIALPITAFIIVISAVRRNASLLPPQASEPAAE